MVLPITIYTVSPGSTIHCLLYPLVMPSLYTLSLLVLPFTIYCHSWCSHSLFTVSLGATIRCLLSLLVLPFTVYTVSPMVLPFTIYTVSPGAAIAVYSLPRCFDFVCVCMCVFSSFEKISPSTLKPKVICKVYYSVGEPDIVGSMDSHGFSGGFYSTPDLQRHHPGGIFRTCTMATATTVFQGRIVWYVKCQSKALSVLDISPKCV